MLLTEPSEFVLRNGSLIEKSKAPLYPLFMVNLLKRAKEASRDCLYLVSLTPFNNCSSTSV